MCNHGGGLPLSPPVNIPMGSHGPLLDNVGGIFSYISLSTPPNSSFGNAIGLSPSVQYTAMTSEALLSSLDGCNGSGQNNVTLCTYDETMSALNIPRPEWDSPINTPPSQTPPIQIHEGGDTFLDEEGPQGNFEDGKETDSDLEDDCCVMGGIEETDDLLNNFGEDINDILNHPEMFVPL